MIYEKIRVINGNPINIDGYNILITISIIINIAPYRSNGNVPYPEKR